MCIGVPMRVVEPLAGRALCEGLGERRMIDMTLVGEQAAGTWVLVFLDTAREVVSEKDAALVAQALTALGLAMRGEAELDHLFPDLAGREPELPDHLKSQARKRRASRS
jgi:hydrogenase expression/formation protein HypC